MNKVYDWFEERLEVQAIADDISKYVPPHVNIFTVLVALFSHMLNTKQVLQ
jgi:cytochrome b6